MALTREFKDTIRARVNKDARFRCELFKEAVQSLIDGDVQTGKAVLRDYINATIGFEELSELVEKSPKSLMRMFSPGGNPRMENLFLIINLLQEHTDIQLKVKAV